MTEIEKIKEKLMKLCNKRRDEKDPNEIARLEKRIKAARKKYHGYHEAKSSN